MEECNINGCCLEYLDETHTYICDGIILPSITQMLKIKFGKKYEGIDEYVLQRASERGTQVHKAIEDYERNGMETDCKELRNYKFLKRYWHFDCLDNEVPVILFHKDKPVACGRLDLVLQEDDKVGLGDIKRTASLDKHYLCYQLNLYRIAYQQCYGVDVEFLRGLHLRDDTRRYVEIPINEDMTNEFIEEFIRSNNNE